MLNIASIIGIVLGVLLYFFFASLMMYDRSCKKFLWAILMAVSGGLALLLIDALRLV